MTRRKAFFLGLSGISGCRRFNGSRLNVFNWSSYVAPDTIANFEREFGIRVRYAVYESNEEMLARVFSGNSGWDVVFPTSYLLDTMRHQDLLRELDHTKLPNLGHLQEAFARPVWDAELRWGVPYMWNATGICVSRRAALSPVAWADLWHPSLAGRLTMLNDPVDVFAACLKKLGHSVNSEKVEELRAAQREAIEQKARVRAYINAEVRDQLISGDVLAAQIWSTTAQQAIDESKDLRFVYPSEGFPLYPDVAVVLRESPRSDAAHTFINYLLRPEVAAAIVVAARTATANGAARKLLPVELQTNPTLFPPPSILARGEWVMASPPHIQRLRDRLWTEIKTS